MIHRHVILLSPRIIFTKQLKRFITASLTTPVQHIFLQPFPLTTASSIMIRMKRVGVIETYFKNSESHPNHCWTWCFFLSPNDNSRTSRLGNPRLLPIFYPTNSKSFYETSHFHNKHITDTNQLQCCLLANFNYSTCSLSKH